MIFKILRRIRFFANFFTIAIAMNELNIIPTTRKYWLLEKINERAIIKCIIIIITLKILNCSLFVFNKIPTFAEIKKQY